MSHDDSDVRRLLEQAGPRPTLPEDDLAAIREAARAEWRQQYGERPAPPRRSPGWWIPLAAAATVLVAVGLVWRAQKSGPAVVPPPVAASIELVTGAARWQAEGKSAVDLDRAAVGRPLTSGSALETAAGPAGPGRVALRMAGGASVRLDSDTRARLLSATLVELDRGAIYVDTGAGPARGQEVAVRTRAGLFQGLGTQFEVRARADGAATVLRVREGRVRLDRRSESVLTESGRELAVGDDGRVTRRSISAWGSEWEWILKTAPMLDIEGVKVRTFLDWIARETGRRVELADPKTAEIADSVVLHGSIEHLTPTEAPGVVLPSSGLGHRVSDGTLVVFVDLATPR